MSIWVIHFKETASALGEGIMKQDVRVYCDSFRIFLMYPLKGFPGGSAVKNPRANAGDASSIPGLKRSPGEGNGNPLQYSCLGNPMDRVAWRAMVQRVAKSRTWVSN